MILVNDVSFHYQQEDKDVLPVLNHLSLSLKENAHIAVLGQNGCGKSTLAKHLNALLLPTEGTVKVDDLDTAIEKNLYDVRSRVGMVFQNPDNQLVATTVMEEVAFGPENIGLSPKEIAKRVEEALAVVGMSAFKDASPHHLSGGQKQRIAIASVIAMKPSYIVFDEPTAMLDPRGRAQVIETMLNLNKNEHIGVINITHFMEEAALADRVIVMDKGQIVLDGSPKEVFHEVDLLDKLKLDVPVGAALANRLRKDFPNIPSDILSLEELVEVLCPLN